MFSKLKTAVVWAFFGIVGMFTFFILTFISAFASLAALIGTVCGSIYLIAFVLHEFFGPDDEDSVKQKPP